MTQVHEVPDDWNPDHRCCLECGNADPDVTLLALTHPVTNQQALACTRHIADVAAVLDSVAPAPHTTDEQVPTTAMPTPASAPAPRPRSRT